MARRKREPMSEGKKNIIAELIEEYDIRTAKDIEDALRDLMGGTIQEMLEAELDEHLGYRSYERSDSSNYRNGKKTKKIRGNLGETEIEVPQDRDGTFEPKVVKKRQKDISGIEQKIISLYAKGMTTRQISDTIEDIYGFEVSDGMVSDITDRLLPQIEDWQNRPDRDEGVPLEDGPRARGRAVVKPESDVAQCHGGASLVPCPENLLPHSSASADASASSASRRPERDSKSSPMAFALAIGNEIALLKRLKTS